MTREQLRAKLEKGERLTPLEMALLDTFLEEDASPVRHLRNSNREEPSLEWRAKLNERILQYASKNAKPSSRNLFRMLVSTSVATACILLFVLLSNHNTTSQNEFGNALLQWHEEAVAMSILPDGATHPNAFENAPNNKNRESSIEKLLYGTLNLEL